MSELAIIIARILRQYEGAEIDKVAMEIAGATRAYYSGAPIETWNRRAPAGEQQQQGPVACQEDLSQMNAGLCDFYKRWIFDGDYLRCTACKRPHIASKADQRFVHASGCGATEISEDYPWQVLIRLLRPLYTHQQPQRPSDDALWDKTLSERDAYHETADQLSGEIAKYFDQDFGEHSSANNPWGNALDFLREQPQAQGSDLDAWRDLAAAMYQAAGAYDMPERVLDALSAAANGESFVHLVGGLLPIDAPVQPQVQGEPSELQEEFENLQAQYHQLASEMVYKGNSVQWWCSKAKAYKKAIGDVWDALKKHGIHADGKTSVVDVVAKLAEKTRAAVPDGESGWLIEDTGQGNHQWIRLIEERTSIGSSICITWTRHSEVALRFAREEDARLFAIMNRDFCGVCKITEHGWIPPQSTKN